MYIKLVHRSLVEESSPGRYDMHPFLQKYSLKLGKRITAMQLNEFKRLFADHYISLVLETISSAKRLSNMELFYATLAREHHNVLYVLTKFSMSQVKIPLAQLLPFVIDTFDVVRNIFPEIVVDWWVAVAKAGFTALNVSTCTSEHDQFANFILYVTDTLVLMGECHNQQVETLLLKLDSLLEQAQNCSEDMLVNFYMKMDSYYHMTGNDQKGFPYLEKFMERMAIKQFSGSLTDQYNVLDQVARHFIVRSQFELALLYLKRMQILLYLFDVAEVQVFCLTELSRFSEGNTIIRDAVEKFTADTHTSDYEKGENCLAIAKMYHYLANYEAEEKWLEQAATYIRHHEGDSTMPLKLYVKCYLQISDMHRDKGQIPEAVHHTLKLLEVLNGHPDVPQRDLYKVRKSLGDLYFLTDAYDEAKPHYEEALRICALLHDNCALEMIQLKLIQIELLSWNIGTASWKFGVMFKDFASKLLFKISSWWSTQPNVHASITAQRHVTNTEVTTMFKALDIWNLRYFRNVMFHDSTWRLVQKVHFKFSPQIKIIGTRLVWEIFLSFFSSVLVVCILLLAVFGEKYYFTLENFNYIAFNLMPSGAVLLVLLSVLFRRIFILQVVCLTWLIYVVCISLPYTLLTLLHFSGNMTLYIFPRIHFIFIAELSFPIFILSSQYPTPKIATVGLSLCFILSNILVIRSLSYIVQALIIRIAVLL